IGLLITVLLAIPLGYLPQPLSQYLPLASAVLLAYLGGMIFTVRKREIIDFMRALRRPAPQLLPADNNQSAQASQHRYLHDTSAIIDGRIAGVSKTGFLEGVLIVPRFILNELQNLADSGDELRRSKGRRGLELLNQMQKDATMPIEVIDVEV